MTSTQWLPGIFALAVALAGAGIYLLLARREGAADTGPVETGPDHAQRELERAAEAALEAVRAHKENRHQHTEETFGTELRRLELAAAAALRARDEGRRQPAAAASAAPARTSAPATGVLGFFDRHPALKASVWISGVVLFFVALGLVLSEESAQRTETMEATGTVPPSAVPAGLEHDHDGDGIPDHPAESDPPQLAQSMARFESNPLDINAAGEASHFLIQLQRVDEADRIVQRALAVDPFAAELRVHSAVIRGIRGDTEGARKELQLLADLHPGSEEGLLFLGSLAMLDGNRALGLEQFERFALEVPAELHPAELLAAIAELRLDVRGGDVPPKQE